MSWLRLRCGAWARGVRGRGAHPACVSGGLWALSEALQLLRLASCSSSASTRSNASPATASACYTQSSTSVPHHPHEMQKEYRSYSGI